MATLPRAMGDALIDVLPDLVLLLKRDGSIVSHSGGQGVSELRPHTGAGIGESGGSVTPVWSNSTTTLIRQLTRRTIAQRSSAEARFHEQGRHYVARVTAQSPERALCVIRAVLPGSQDDSVDTTGERPRPELDRRGFLKRFKQSLSNATLREKAIAVAVLYIDGIPDIAQVIAAKVSEQIMSLALLRLSSQQGQMSTSGPRWYLGQLSENILAVVVETSERDAIEACVGRVCESLREPISVGDAEFCLAPYAGVGILSLDASAPKALLDMARGAAAEARRAGSSKIHFFSDTMQMQSLARMDIARELREAVTHGVIRLRYKGRHDMRSGEVTTWAAYMQWPHALRGEIKPREFLRVAESTGLATELSRSVLRSLVAEFAALGSHVGPEVRLSFGPLRDHVVHADFVADIEQFLRDGGVPAERLELRIAEKAFIARDPRDFDKLQQRGVRFVVDEVARGIGSLSALAKAPLWGLQLDREWVRALRTDEVAYKVCRAGITMATSLGLWPIATGVDDEAQRDALLALGCRLGMGDLYRATPDSAEAPLAAEG